MTLSQAQRSTKWFRRITHMVSDIFLDWTRKKIEFFMSKQKKKAELLHGLAYHNWWQYANWDRFLFTHFIEKYLLPKQICHGLLKLL